MKFRDKIKPLLRNVRFRFRMLSFLVLLEVTSQGSNQRFPTSIPNLYGSPPSPSHPPPPGGNQLTSFLRASSNGFEASGLSTLKTLWRGFKVAVLEYILTGCRTAWLPRWKMWWAPRTYVFDVTSIGQRSSLWTCNSVKVEVKFHVECKLHCRCAQHMLFTLRVRCSDHKHHQHPCSSKIPTV